MPFQAPSRPQDASGWGGMGQKSSTMPERAIGRSAPRLRARACSVVPFWRTPKPIAWLGAKQAAEQRAESFRNCSACSAILGGHVASSFSPEKVGFCSFGASAHLHLQNSASPLAGPGVRSDRLGRVRSRPRCQNAPWAPLPLHGPAEQRFQGANQPLGPRACIRDEPTPGIMARKQPDTAG
jgi:hypothetical protein